MAAYDGSATSKVTHKGPGAAAPLFVEHKLAQALANADTLKMKVPAGYADWIPVNLAVFTDASPRVRVTTLAITSHDAAKGETILTASGAVADKSTVLVEYAPAT